MTTDAIACERQFLDHLAPVWAALSPSARGRFLVDAALLPQAAALGIDADPIDADLLRSTSMAPLARREDGPRALVASIGDTKVGRRLGYRRFAFIEHGAGQAYIGVRGPNSRNPSYPGGIDREDTELFMVPNEYAARLWHDAYPDAAVEIIGSPRLDSLPRKRIDPIEAHPVVAISFHWPAPVCPEADTALGHYLSILRELAQRFHLIGHAHPKGDWPQTMARIYRRLGIEFVRDFDEVCRRADVYVCDNSSTIFEFAATGRPVVVLNDPKYRRNVHHGLRFWDAAHVGVNVWDPALLGDAIDEALRDSPEQQAKREDALSLVYAVRTNAAVYAAAALARWVAEPVAVAA